VTTITQLTLPESAPLKKGTRVIWTDGQMPGEIVDLTPSDLRVKWASGYKLDISGWTLWCSREYARAGLIEMEQES
jgi:hypothetical protein